MRADIAERSLFLRSFLAHPRQVGAILPTSRRAVRAMLDMADLPAARLVLELGAGTGSHTGEILARLGPEARLLAFEIDPALAGALAAKLRDPRLRVVTDSAEHVEAYLDGARADVVVSAIPFTSLPAPLPATILERARDALRPGGVMLLLQYSPLLQGELRRVFGSVRRLLSLLNVPPAFLFACTVPAPPL